ATPAPAVPAGPGIADRAAARRCRAWVLSSKFVERHGVSPPVRSCDRRAYAAPLATYRLHALVSLALQIFHELIDPAFFQRGGGFVEMVERATPLAAANQLADVA